MRTFFDDVCLEYEEASSSVKNATQLLDDTDLADRLGAPHAMRRLLTERELEAQDFASSHSRGANCYRPI
jgi:hypothetical protein